MKLIGYLLKKVIPLFFGSLVFFSLILNLVDLFMNIATYLQNNCNVKDILLIYFLFSNWKNYAIVLIINK